MKKLVIAIACMVTLGALFFMSGTTPIVQSADYEYFINKGHLEKTKESLLSQISFWENKLASAPGNFVFEKRLAGLLAADFKVSGNVEKLHRSNDLLQGVNDRIPGQVGVLQSLAANAVTQHEFRKAEKYLTEALELGEKKFATSLMLAEVKMERGNLFSANYILQDIASVGHFDYLVRQMKFHDQKGDLESAIKSMELAAEQAKASGSPKLINWSLSNLGDMYGHDGRINKSYQTFLEALSYDSADLHSLRGIAWIAFSHDKNTAEAKRILHYLKSIHPVPDYDLMLAEIADFEKEESAAEFHRMAFLEQANNPAYGNMYQAYICELKSDLPVAITIAEAEVEERPHPMSYSLLAWANLQNGQAEIALNTLQNHVLFQTEEPMALYHAGMIFNANGEEDKAEKYLRDALDAAFELGPGLVMEIEEQLMAL